MPSKEEMRVWWICYKNVQHSCTPTFPLWRWGGGAGLETKQTDSGRTFSGPAWVAVCLSVCLCITILLSRCPHVYVCQQCRGGVRVRVWIREHRKIKRRSKALLSLWLANLDITRDTSLSASLSVCLSVCCSPTVCYLDISLTYSAHRGGWKANGTVTTEGKRTEWV